MRFNVIRSLIFTALFLLGNSAVGQDQIEAEGEASIGQALESSQEANAQADNALEENAPEENAPEDTKAETEVPKTTAPQKSEARDLRNRQVSGPLRESQTIDLSDTIVGNQEQPTVLYIVPWKDAQDTTILYLPLSSKALEELFGHIDRVEHQRQVQFIEKLDE